MTREMKDKMAETVQDYHLPRYEEIPNVGLYLEQVVKYISDYLAPLGDVMITGSMISNYVKQKLIESPVKKQYNRDQIASLIFIAIAKSVLSLENIQTILEMQRATYEAKRAYEYFCREFENLLFYAFGINDTYVAEGVEDSDQKMILRNVLIAISHKIHVEKCLAVVSRELEQTN